MNLKRLNLRVWLTITILSGLLAFSVTDSCFGQTSLTIGVPYSDSLSSSGEQKFYQINVPAGQHLFVMLDKASGSWRSSLYIGYGALPTTSTYDAAAIDSYSDEAVEIPITQAGTYYIMVMCTYGSGGSYTVTPHNNTTLASLTTGTAISDSLSSSGQQRFYQINVPAGQHLFVMLDKASGSWRSSLYIGYGALPTTSTYDAAAIDSYSDEAVEIPITQAGTYYIMVMCTYGSGGTYTLSAKSYLSSENPDILYYYDQLGRLVRVTYPSGIQILYSYDDRGNRLEYTVNIATDITPPETTITGGPSGTIAVNSATFTFTGSDNVTPAANLVYATYLQGYDSGWSSFSSSTSKSYSNLPNGSYTFYVMAKDQAGNEDPTPATSSFTVAVASLGVLAVTPGEGLSSSGKQGGPFSPSTKTYALQNTGSSSLNWTASNGQSWVTLSSTGGTLVPGASTPVTVSINSNANSLPSNPNPYSDTVSFTNTTNSNGNTTRPVSLTVNAGQTLNAPILEIPLNGAPGQSTTVTLGWFDTNSNEQGYKIRIKPSGGSYSYFSVGQDVTSYPASGLSPNTTHYWNVQAVGNGTATLDSPWANSGTDWSFTTAGQPAVVGNYTMNPNAPYSYAYGDNLITSWQNAGGLSGYFDLSLEDFNFKFYGYSVNNLRISMSGYITFADSGMKWHSGAINYAIIAPFWDGFVAGGYWCNVWWGISGTAPNRRLVIEWYQVLSWDVGTEAYSFEVILYESTNKIRFQYLNVVSGTYHDFGASATVGIENFDGTKGVQYSFNGSTPLSNGLAIEFTPSQAVVSCPGDSLQAAVEAALPGDIIKVSGTCNENVLIRNEKVRFILDGQNVATIHGSNSGSPTLNVRGKGIVIQNFEITGGSDGINVNRGSNAQIIHNNIHNTGEHGIVIDQLSFSVIKNNNIHNNPGHGILVRENSIARIGFDSDSDSTASPNTIQGNGGNGITVLGTSNARIVGNTIANNMGDGIGVFGHSQADIASNTINNNGGNGISVSEKSGIQLGEDNPTTFFDQPNTTTVNNVGNGIACSMGTYVRGHLGSANQINGNAGQLNIGTNCPQSLVTP